MKLFDKYVYPEIKKSIKYGVNSTTVIFDQIMKPSLFTESNMNQLTNFINESIFLGDINVKCKLTTTNYIGNRYILELTW